MKNLITFVLFFHPNKTTGHKMTTSKYRKSNPDQMGAIEIGQRLMHLRPHWPTEERLKWCVDNAYHPDTVNRSYLRGSVTNLTVARSLLNTIEDYIISNDIPVNP